MPDNKNKPIANNPITEPELGKPVDIDQPGTDSVSEDLNKFKKFFRMLSGNVNQKAKPVAQKVQQKVVEKTPTQVIQKIPKKGGFGWVKLLFIPIFIVFVALIMLSLSNKNEQNNNGKDPEVVPTTAVEPTPTLEPFQPVRDSIYVDDIEIIELEEQLNVINNEMFSVPLRDSTLNPPVLDFNISF